MDARPFLTYYRENSDYNAADARNEVALMNTRNEAIESFLAGDVQEDYLLDLLDHQGIEPEEYIQSVEDEIVYFMNNPHLLYS